ncbi:hypothetical protein K2X89_15405 [Myxococcota bacterium]|nr:hypothetical protein [Myxococcota bacterium]
MSLEALGSLGDFVGGIGVVVSLIYLAQQVRRNTQSVEAATIQSTTEHFTDFMKWLAGDADLTRIFAAGSQDFEALSPVERLRYSGIMNVALRRTENALAQTRRGLLPEDAWASTLNQLRLAFQAPGARAWWRSGGRDGFNPELRQWVEIELIGADGG